MMKIMDYHHSAFVCPTGQSGHRGKGQPAKPDGPQGHSHPEPYVLDSVRSHSPTSAPEYANEGLMLTPFSHEGKDTQLGQDDHQQETLPGHQPTAYAMALNHAQEDDSNVYEDVEIMD